MQLKSEMLGPFMGSIVCEIAHGAELPNVQICIWRFRMTEEPPNEKMDSVEDRK